jgi:signal transduction histidine kinase
MRKAGGLLNTTRPMSGSGRWLRLGTMIGLLGFTAVAELSGWLGMKPEGQRGAAVAAVLVIAAVAAATALPWHRWPEDWQALVPLALVGAVVLLDYVGDLYYIVAVPVLWLALFHTRRVLVTGIAVAAVAIFLPRALAPDVYQLVPLAEVILVFTVIVVAGLGMHELVRHVREAAVTMGVALEREREASERLRQLDQTKNDFVATVSHDLRTPLTSIVGNTEMLLDGSAGDLTARQRRLVGAIERNANRLDVLIGDLLLLSRIESGTLRMNARPVAITDIIDGTLEALAANITSDIQLDVHRPDERVLVDSDPAQLERVTTNLLSNALKFTPPGGRVTVTVTADAGQVQVSVSDTGIGIPAEELGQVFDRFFRSSRSQRQARPGTGLGLTIAKSIVESHHGTIRADLNPHCGTIFTITLPRSASAADSPQRETAA